MTVDELIAALLKQDKNAEVFFNAENVGRLYAVEEVWTSEEFGVVFGGEEQ